MAKSAEKPSKSPIVNGVLCYTSTARHSLRNDDIVRVCLAFFNDDDIIKGKDILCDIIGEKSKRRRNENRVMNEVKDILEILRKCDETKRQLPKFVVDSYDGLPPTSGFEVIAQSLTALNDEIVSLKKEIEQLKESRIEQTIASQDMTMMKEDLIVIKGEIRKLNHKLMNDDIRQDSILLENLHSSGRTTNHIEDDSSNTDVGAECIDSLIMNIGNRLSSRSSIIHPNAPPFESNDLLEIANRSIQDDGGLPSAPSYSQVVENDGRHSDIISVRPKSTVKKPEQYGIQTTRLTSAQRKRDYHERSAAALVDEEGFTLVQKKKKTRDNIVGSRKYSGDRVMKCARNIGDLYLGNLDLDVTENEIINYIKDETGICVDKCIPLASRNPNCKAFKISVCFENRLTLLSPEIWPEGIICRKFYNPRNKYVNKSE